MKVTIQDVLDAGGEIRGLPVVSGETKYICASPKVNKPNNSIAIVCADSNLYILKPKDATVYPDGIRIIEIDGRLYRVTGHIQRGLASHGNIFCDAKYEPLIPDKPAEHRCETCKHFIDRMRVQCEVLFDIRDLLMRDDERKNMAAKELGIIQKQLEDLL